MQNDAVVLSPTLSRLVRRFAVWIAIALIAVLIALVVLITLHQTSNKDPLATTNASPNGAKALVTVLGEHGVDVVTANSLRDVRLALATPELSDPATTTVLFYDPNAYLTPEQLTQLDDLVGTVILVEPTSDVLDQFAPNVLSVGQVDETLDAGCTFGPAVKAGTISGAGLAYRLTPNTDGDTCFVTGKRYSLIRTEDKGSTVTVLGAGAALNNGTILQNGNAALGLNLLGQTRHLVWYIPTIADLGDSGLTMSDLDPQWVEPVAALLFVVGFAAILWRGRRLGPLVVENLPATVRASETMFGRARLYEKASARRHALDALRIGTISRLAALVGLSRSATVDDVIGLVASISGGDPGAVRALLVDTVPSNDRELVALSDQLLELERVVHAAMRP